MQQDHHVFIAIPCGRAAPDVDHTVSLTDTIVTFVEAGLKRPERHIIHGNCYVHYCRNMLAWDFLTRTDCTHLFFWDDDVAAPPGGLLRLMSYDRDITVAPYPKKSDPNGKPSAMRKPTKEWPYKLTSGIPDEAGLLECDLAATGYMLIKRHVIETLWEKHADRTFYDPDHDAKVVDIFPTGLIPGFPLCAKSGLPRWWGEDNAFSLIAREAGFKIWMDDVLPLTHAGRQVWRGSFTENADAAWQYEVMTGTRAKRGPLARKRPQLPAAHRPAP